MGGCSPRKKILMKYQPGDGYRLLKKLETVPKGSQRRVATDPNARWVPTASAGTMLTEIPWNGFIYRVPKSTPVSKVPLSPKKPKEAKPREIVLELLSDDKGHEFQEIHAHLESKAGKRTEKATRVLLQDLKDSGLLVASAVEYSRMSKGVQG